MAYRYKTIKVDGRSMLLHRYVMEQHLGRKLVRGEQVHHVNGDRFDNRIENLQVMSAQEHMHHHKQKHPLFYNCDICGDVFCPPPTKRGGRKKTCSEVCANKLRSRTEKKTKGAAALARAQFMEREAVA